MADLICRWRNGTPSTVVELVNSLPHKVMPSSQFREIMESQWNGDFFRTPYQLACQLGLYYESEDGYYYPRFFHDITEIEAHHYLELWIKKYYVPNPYVNKDGFPDLECPSYVLRNLYDYVETHPECDYVTAYKKCFFDEAKNNDDIVRNYINRYSKLLSFSEKGFLSIININEPNYFEFMDKNDKKKFFETFHIEGQKKLIDTFLSLNEEEKKQMFFDYMKGTGLKESSCKSYFSLSSNTDILNSVKDRAQKDSLFSVVDLSIVKSIYNDVLPLDNNKKQNNALSATISNYEKFLKYINFSFSSDSANLGNKKNPVPLQQIFYGAPGTGKSHTINIMTKGKSVIRTTFHPDSDYSTFVGAYKPTMGLLPICNEKGEPVKINDIALHKEQIKYSFIKQAFLKAYLGAWKKYSEGGENAQPQYLIIEEINRGNCAQIFGDLFQLLDRQDNGFSCYPIEADADIQQEIARAFSKEKEYKIESVSVNDAVEDYVSNYEGSSLSEDILKGRIMLLPPNLYILATMNTSDQSLFPIDSAFKRRWDWEYVPINYSNTDWKIVLGDIEYSWVSFQEIVNNKIKVATDGSEDKQMGDFFVNVKHKGGIIDSNLLLNKIAFYLWNDVCKDGEGDIFKILNDDKKTEEITFSEFFKGDSIKKLQQWMDFLGVKPGSGEQNDDTAQDKEDFESKNEDE